MYYPDDPADEIIKIIKTTDELGFHACYLTDSSLRRDLWTLLGAAAVQTKRVRLGANAVRIAFRDPALIALAIATLDELSAGRTDTVVCFGGRRFWHQHALEPARTTRPWARVREAIQVIKTFLGSSRLDFEGEYFRYNALEASMLPLTRPAPVHLASSGGPRAMRAAGEIADGMHIAPACSRRACETATAMVSEGARRAGRDPQNLDIALCPIWVCSSDAEAARRVARIKTSWYLPSLPSSCMASHRRRSGRFEKPGRPATFERPSSAPPPTSPSA